MTNLEAVVERCPAVRRTEIAKRVTNLFVENANSFSTEQIQLFDDVFNRLVTQIEAKARFELSIRLASLDNAPPALIRRLAQDENVSVATPILQCSDTLGEADLVEVAKNNSQGHLLAISNRKSVGESITDILVRRGDREVVRNVAQNAGARLSSFGFSVLVRKAKSDGILAEKVGLRNDIPAPVFRALVLQATNVVKRRLFAMASAEVKAEIRRLLAEISDQVGPILRSTNCGIGYENVLDNQSKRKIDETEIAKLANQGKYAETVSALSAMGKISLGIIDRVMADKDTGGILIVCKAAGLTWPTARAIILLRTKGVGMSPLSLESKGRQFERMGASTAQQVVNQWQAQRA